MSLGFESDGPAHKLTREPTCPFSPRFNSKGSVSRNKATARRKRLDSRRRPSSLAPESSPLQSTCAVYRGSHLRGVCVSFT